MAVPAIRGDRLHLDAGHARRYHPPTPCPVLAYAIASGTGILRYLHVWYSHRCFGTCEQSYLHTASTCIQDSIYGHARRYHPPTPCPILAYGIASSAITGTCLRRITLSCRYAMSGTDIG
eukprot:1448719-Rhodomonas_salina.1